MCRLCGRDFKAVAGSHLARIHGWDSDHPVHEYQERFGPRTAMSRATLRTITQGVRNYYERAGRRWTRGRVCRVISELAKKGAPLNHRSVHLQHPGLASAAGTLFPSWDDALRAAHLDPDQIRLMRPWTRTQILAQVCQLGRYVSRTEIARRNPALLGAAQRTFGGWVPALAEAGIRHPLGRRNWKWSRAVVLESIRDRARRGLPLNSQRVSGLWRAANLYFGGWRQALQAAGCETHLSFRFWTRAELLTLLKQVHDKHGRVTNQLLEQVKRPGFVWPIVSIRRVFGTLSRAKKAAQHLGIRPSADRRHWTKPLVIEAIRQETKRRRPLNVSSVQTRDSGLLRAGVVWFGSWARALKAAGLDPQALCRRPWWNRERLIAELRRIGKSDPEPSSKRYDKLRSAARKLYGGWHSALKAAGLPGRQHRRRNSGA